MLLILRLVVFIRTAICAFCRKEKYQLLSFFLQKIDLTYRKIRPTFFDSKNSLNLSICLLNNRNHCFYWFRLFTGISAAASKGSDLISASLLFFVASSRFWSSRSNPYDLKIFIYWFKINFSCLFLLS